MALPPPLTVGRSAPQADLVLPHLPLPRCPPEHSGPDPRSRPRGRGGRNNAAQCGGHRASAAAAAASSSLCGAGIVPGQWDGQCKPKQAALHAQVVRSRAGRVFRMLQALTPAGFPMELHRWPLQEEARY